MYFDFDGIAYLSRILMRKLKGQNPQKSRREMQTGQFLPF